MKAYLCLLLLSLVFSQTVILVSDISTTTVTSPTSSVTTIQNYHTTYHPNFLGLGAQWIWSGPGVNWADGFTATFESLFYADCQADSVLWITADNIFTAFVNGNNVGTGGDWTKKFKFNIKLICGLNNLTVVAVNKDQSSPASLTFGIIQDQSSCYSCDGAAFYNRNTCQCQCISKCPCRDNFQYQWFDYPICGCKCGIMAKCAVNHFFNQKTCQCDCAKKYCQPGFIQSQQTCECVACTPQKCPLGSYWDQNKCSCVKGCIENMMCIATKVWDPIKCACVCPKPQICGFLSKWDDNICQCVNLITSPIAIGLPVIPDPCTLPPNNSPVLTSDSPILTTQIVPPSC